MCCLKSEVGVCEAHLRLARIDSTLVIPFGAGPESILPDDFVMPSQKREARLRARCAGHPRPRNLRKKTWMAGTKPGHDENTVASFPGERSHLLLPGRRLALTLLLPRLLLGAMAAVEASGGSAKHAVMAGIVTGDAADHGAFQAAFGVGRRG
jgi:hypothetical protein